MFRISMAVAFAAFIASSAAGISTASADSWGCSEEKCMAACTKAGGKFCGKYCSKAMNDKRMAGTCK